jgi:hypothetical protein
VLIERGYDASAPLSPPATSTCAEPERVRTHARLLPRLRHRSACSRGRC